MLTIPAEALTILSLAGGILCLFDLWLLMRCPYRYAPAWLAVLLAVLGVGFLTFSLMYLSFSSYVIDIVLRQNLARYSFGLFFVSIDVVLIWLAFQICRGAK